MPLNLSAETRMRELGAEALLVRLSLYQLHRIVEYQPAETLREVLARGGVTGDAVETALHLIRARHAVLEEEHREGRIEVWKDPLLRFLEGRRADVFDLAWRLPRGEGDPDPVQAAAEEIVFQRAVGGNICSRIASAVTIRSQLGRIEVEKWLLGNRLQQQPSMDQVNAAVGDWNRQWGPSHKEWLDVEIAFLLGAERLWTRLGKE